MNAQLEIKSEAGKAIVKRTPEIETFPKQSRNGPARQQRRERRKAAKAAAAAEEQPEEGGRNSVMNLIWKLSKLLMNLKTKE